MIPITAHCINFDCNTQLCDAQHEDAPDPQIFHYFSKVLLPPLGAQDIQTNLRKYIISPYDTNYRCWEIFLIVLVAYCAWANPFELGFINEPKLGALFIADTVMDIFFAIDIIVTFFASSSLAIPPHPITQKLQNIRIKAHNRDFREIYAELEGIFWDLKLSPEDLMENAKGFAVQGLDVVKRIYASSTMVLTGSTNMVLSIGVSIASGAAGVFNFFSQSMVFFWLMYYLIIAG